MDLSGKSIMIFGAGMNQLELIREARQLGITTVVIDPQENPPGKPEADYFYCVDGSDYETTRTIARKHKVSGIVTGQMEKPLRLMAKLAQDLGLIFNSPNVTERCIDKWLMKETFLAKNIACAEGILIKHNESLHEKLSGGIKFPVIIKPRDSFSSRGVYKCNDFQELASHIEESRYFSSAGDVLAEEFLEGKEFSVEAVTYQGVTTIIQFTEKFITPYPNTVEMGHLQPADLTLAEKDAISSVVKSALRALGIENSASHTEVMLTAEGPKVIETGARLGGDFIGSYLTRASTGVSMDRAAIQIALGFPPDLTGNEKAYSFMKYFELSEGKVVQQVGNWEEVLAKGDVVYAGVTLTKGDIVPAVTDSSKRPGFIMVKGNDRQDVFQKAEAYCNQLTEYIKLK
jgi:biotin carboxylase